MIALLFRRVQRFALCCAQTIDKRPFWLLVLYSLCYFTLTCWLATQKLLDNDELFTYYIAQRPTFHDVWNALATGAEQLPPFFYILTRATFACFGVSHLSIRLPQIIGFWLMTICLFKFVSRRSSALHGCIALLFPFVTLANTSILEARPYGIVLGLCGLAVLSWQSAADGTRRTLSLCVLTASVAATISTHYTSILILFPLLLGESIRVFSRRRLDVAVLAALTLALAPLALFLPLIQGARSYSLYFWARPHWPMLPRAYQELLAPAALPLAGILILGALIASCSRESGLSVSLRRFWFRPHELVLVLGLLVLPVVAFVFALAVTNAFSIGYALSTIIGFGIAVPWALSCWSSFRTEAAVIAIITLLGFGALEAARNYHRFTSNRASQLATYNYFRGLPHSGLDIIIANGQRFFELSHYLPPGSPVHLRYLADPQASVQILGYDTVDRCLLELRRWAPLQVTEFREFIAGRQPFWVYGQPDEWSWLFARLADLKQRVEIVDRDGSQYLFLVNAP
jgi:hypothetical protein